MKINWGWSLAIAMGLFMIFILSYVFKVQSDSTYDHEMVVEDYYKQEIGFQKEIDKKQNAENLAEKVKISVTEQGIEIQFPSSFTPENIKGKISLYRPSSQKLDFDKSISISTSNLLIPKSELAGGRWDISINWTYEGIEYLNKETIYL